MNENLSFKDLLENADLHNTELHRQLASIKSDDLAEEDHKNLRTEIKCSTFYLKDGVLNPVKEVTDKMQNVKIITDISVIDEQEWNYIEERYNTTKSLLKIRYAHLLWLKKKHSEYGHTAFDHYKLLLDKALKDYADKNFRTYIKILPTAHNLALALKDKRKEFKQFLLDLFYAPNVPLVWLNLAFSIILDSSLFSKDDYQGMTSYLLGRLDWKENHYSINNMILQNCLRLVQKENIKPFKIYELLGENEYRHAEKRLLDDSTGMIPLMFYNKAIIYFEQSQKIELLERAKQKYANQKKNLLLKPVAQTFSNELIQRHSTNMDDHVTKLLNQPVMAPYIFLVYNSDILMTEDQLSSPKQSLFPPFNLVVFDKNNNSNNLSNEKRITYDNFMKLLIHLQAFTVPLMERLFINGIKRGRMNCDEVISYFNSTWFSHCLMELDSKDTRDSFSMMELVGNGIESLLLQIERSVQNEKYIPSYQLAVDSLTPKVEGIIRVIARLAKIPVTKNTNNGTYEMLLDDLLRDERINLIIAPEDMCLIKYLLTNSGWNLRNDIAHNFSRPRHYTKTMAFLLLLVLFRLSKYRLVDVSESEN